MPVSQMVWFSISFQSLQLNTLRRPPNPTRGTTTDLTLDKCHINSKTYNSEFRSEAHHSSSTHNPVRVTRNTPITTATSTSYNSSCADHCCEGCDWIWYGGYFIWIFIMCVIQVVLSQTLPSSLPYGDKMLATYEPILIDNFDPTDITSITIHQTTSTFTANFYATTCSSIDTEEHPLNYIEFLDVTNETVLEIEEFYFVKGSGTHFFFPSQELQLSSRCVALIHIFSSPSDYRFFISEQGFYTQSFSYCLPPDSPLNFDLSATGSNKYYFVGMENFASTTLNYTVTGRVLKYDVTNLSCTRCNFPATCSISLSDYSGGEDVCILAALQTADKFVTIDYTTHSDRKEKQMLAYYVISGIIWVLSVLLSIPYCCLLYLKNKLKDRCCK